ERPGDEDAIRELTKTAFASAPFSDGTEPAIIDALRASGDLALSLVAEREGRIIAQVTFSPVTVDGDYVRWVGLGPVSVEPSLQKRGVGGRLIRDGLRRIKTMGARACVLVGDPAYYARFGFDGDCGLDYAGIEARYVQRLLFAPPALAGALRYCDAFEDAVSP
ncbi:MAG: N-acetyltransferase, partial [Pseudomonadota bacterium]